VCVLKAGCVSFHHSLTIHGSRENRSLRPRLSIAIHMIPDGTRFSAKARSGHSSMTLCQPRDGEPFAGPYFPVIYREGDPLANVWRTL
jgi:ectoine hydroxylase-related dioxygenase (phytanoyl-CoA dioxygenase family)